MNIIDIQTKRIHIVFDINCCWDAPKVTQTKVAVREGCRNGPLHGVTHTHLSGGPFFFFIETVTKEPIGDQIRKGLWPEGKGWIQSHYIGNVWERKIHILPKWLKRCLKKGDDNQ